MNAFPHEGARASIVNRTHRVVREQALTMQRQREHQRSLWVPVAVCSALLLVAMYAAWTVFDSSDAASNGVPDASDQMFLMLLWMVPITAVAMGIVWFRRLRSGGVPR